MEHTGFMTLDTPNSLAMQADAGCGTVDGVSPFGAKPFDRPSEARRFLFAAAHHGKRNDATSGNFPGKLAWIAVALFVLSVLIAVIG